VVRTLIGLTLIVGCDGIAGCVPEPMTVDTVVAPDAQYLSEPHFVGSRDWVYYPYHGIHISIYSTGTFRMGLHVPPGTTAQLNGDIVRVSAITKSGPVEQDIVIKEVPHSSFGDAIPTEFTTVGQFHDWHLYTRFCYPAQPGPCMMPKDIIRGTIQLPPITIDGVQYEPQVLQLEHHAHAGIVVF